MNSDTISISHRFDSVNDRGYAEVHAAFLNTFDRLLTGQSNAFFMAACADVIEQLLLDSSKGPFIPVDEIQQLVNERIKELSQVHETSKPKRRSVEKTKKTVFDGLAKEKQVKRIVDAIAVQLKDEEKEALYHQAEKLITDADLVRKRWFYPYALIDEAVKAVAIDILESKANINDDNLVEHITRVIDRLATSCSKITTGRKQI